MALFVSDAKIRHLNLCHLLYTKVDENEIISNYGFTREEILAAKEDLPRFDEFQYCRKKYTKSLRRK